MSVTAGGGAAIIHARADEAVLKEPSSTSWAVE